MSVLTYRYRVKGPKNLSSLALNVNTVWNYCGDVHNQSRRWGRRWVSQFDLCKLVAGSTKLLGLHSDTIQDVCRHFADSRKKKGRRPRWRVSQGKRRSLGWIPFQAARAIQMDENGVVYLGKRYRLWMHRPVGGRILSGSFSEDARGRWYLNLACEVPQENDCGVGTVALDLGLGTLATTSDGEKIENPRPLARHAKALARAQRAGRKKRARAIHAKISNARRHSHHVTSHDLVHRYERIIVGDVSSSKLARTRMAKSVLDAGWSMLRNFLRYKAIGHGGTYDEVSEAFTTQACSACGTLGGPRGLEGLRVREWECADCGAKHDRDVNAAVNLLLFSGQNTGLQSTESPGL